MPVEPQDYLDSQVSTSVVPEPRQVGDTLEAWCVANNINKAIALTTRYWPYWLADLVGSLLGLTLNYNDAGDVILINATDELWIG
jgi:hypothetical protein